MKRSLAFALAAGACGLATAQSSVAVFGTLDIGLVRGIGSISSRTQLSSTNTTSSRLGFRGVEDLGGGMKAGFWLEAALVPDDGQGAPTSINNQASGTVAAPAGTQGLVFARRSTVSLSGNWGELRLGRDVSPHSYNHIVFDPFDNKGVGVSQAYLNYSRLYPGAGPHTRASNTFGYLLPDSLGGVYGQAMHYLGENPSGAANSDDGTGTSVRIGYGNRAFTGAISAARTKYVAGDVKTVNVGGSYNFGPATVTGIWDRTRAGALTGEGWLAGLIVPFGPAEVRAAYSVFKSDATGAPRARKLAAGMRYHLSKRTAVYADIAKVGNRGTSAQTVGGAVTAAGASSSGVDFGLRHSF
jgi:predicted porin